MSRRDTIIVAVLVNAALLLVLFATGTHSTISESKSTGQVMIAQAPSKPIAPAPSKVSSKAPAPQEELFSSYIPSVPTFAPTKEEEIVLQESVELLLSPVREKPLIERKSPEELCFVNVTVKKGDFLEKIAKANMTTVTAIMQSNQLSSTQLKIGQVLKIPVSNKAALIESPPTIVATTPPPTITPAATGDMYYTVKDGDNPWLIASKNNIRVDDLLRLNGLDEQKARRLRPGDRLKIR